MSAGAADSSAPGVSEATTEPGALVDDTTGAVTVPSLDVTIITDIASLLNVAGQETAMSTAEPAVVPSDATAPAAPMDPETQAPLKLVVVSIYRPPRPLEKHANAGVWK